MWLHPALGQQGVQPAPPPGWKAKPGLQLLPNWPGAALYPQSNFYDIVPKLLSTDTFTNLVLLPPTSDLTNLPGEVREDSHQALAEQSALNLYHTAVKALKKNQTLKKVVMFEMPPRDDSSHLSNLAKSYNSALRGLVTTSPVASSLAQRITVVGHPSLTTTTDSQRQALFLSLIHI